MEFSEYALDCMNRARSVGWDLSLSSVKALLNEVDNPQDKVKAVHVTGTNGKGSTCAFLNEILVNAGYRVGRFTSPAVESEFERYTINGCWINESDYHSLFETVARGCEIVELKGYRYPSIFEIEVVMAYLYFAMSECDIMIIEVGMGGALDATNVISKPVLCVFASIGLDHMQWLGEDIASITRNKAGIIKEGACVISALQPLEAERVLKDEARAKGCEFYQASPINSSYQLSLEGAFQSINAGLAVECAYALRLLGYDISDDNIEYGLKNATWPFRFERISLEPEIILDGAHNPPAIEGLKKTLLDLYGDKKMTFVVSVLKDKDYRDMFESILPLAKNIIVTESSSERALDKSSLFNLVKDVAGDALVYEAKSIDDATKAAVLYESDIIVCFGTFTFLRDIKESFKEILN